MGTPMRRGPYCLGAVITDLADDRACVTAQVPDSPDSDGRLAVAGPPPAGRLIAGQAGAALFPAPPDLPEFFGISAAPGRDRCNRHGRNIAARIKTPETATAVFDPEVVLGPDLAEAHRETRIGEILMDGLPPRAPLLMIYEALDPASPRPALVRRLRRDAPCLRAYARSRGVALEDLAVEDLFIRVAPPVILAPAFVGFLKSANGDGGTRFSVGTRRVYRSYAARLARHVVRARRAVLGASDELWNELLEVLGSAEDPPLHRDRNAWALWVFRCRVRAVDPYRPPDPAAAIEDYEAYVAAWGYAASTVMSYRARVVHLLRLLRVVDAAVVDVSPYEPQIEELVELVKRKWQSKRYRPLRPASQTAQRFMLRHFARFVLASTTNGKDAQ